MTNTNGQCKGESPNSPAIPEDSKYEAKVREIAEEIFHKSPDVKCFRWEGCAIQFHEAENFIPLARAVRNNMAEAFKNGFESATKLFGMTLDDYTYLMDKELIELGLIPPPAQLEESGK
ncbi:hypothetical protein ACFOTA_06720 [Chitinophaga sp. GCM10012297]|uniref:Uncharacterized protein n=1 Tax=Chitinophaga chungangae TaxID=2821488 RepID=A0ABS3YB42_9BACT|nr:hypothetical protein [Chitinophaga chungangae]MBO9151893.1 hypothetical protein [Chitinophaga chungangae]